MESFIESLELFIKSIIGNINTCTIGVVEKYDGKRASVTPVISKLFKDGSTLAYKPIENVPVVWLGTSKTIIKMPLSKGDYVLLLFAQSSLDNWLINGGKVAPGDVRSYDITDAIAIPGIFPFIKIDTEFTSKIIFDEEGDIEILTNGKIKLGDAISPLSGIVTGECNCAFTGAPHPMYSTKVIAEK